ncbi:E3 ubiquitin-protein ligase Mdm2 isoform X2 [Lampris incognitus]|nr:E3 ubiquitin-protein ligase Mdm2 isoform X2 [Lampris incognitus]
MITKNLVAVTTQDAQPSLSQQHSQTDRGKEEAESESCSSSGRSSSRRRRRRNRRSSDPGPSRCAEDEEEEEVGGKRRRSDSYSLTFDDSLSWCVIGGLGSGRDRHSSQSSDSHSTSGRSEVSSSDSDNFSVEFEVESIDSDNYDDEDASLSGEDQVYEVTIFETNDSSDEDTEITEADYWKCVKCQELNPPLPRNCNRCWALRQDWLPEVSVNKTNPASSESKALPPKPSADQSVAGESPGVEAEENEGLDVPDGKRAKTPPLPLTTSPSESSSNPNSQELLFSSQETLTTSDSPTSPLPSSSNSKELLPSPLTPSIPELERFNSMETRLPEACLEPCVICQSRPKDGCIVHGRTGHLMACYICAKKLQKRNKLCPVCREPIQMVVLTYVS